MTENKIFPPLVWQDFENKMKLAQTTLSRRDSLKIARRFNAGNGLPCASRPALRQRQQNKFSRRPIGRI